MADKEYKKFSDAAIGDTFERPVLITAIKEALDKNNNTFVKITIMDGTSEISPCMFSTDKSSLAERGITDGIVADAKLRVSEYAGSKSFTIDKITLTRSADVTVDDFIKTPPISADVMFDEMTALLESASVSDGDQHEPLAKLAVTILTDPKLMNRFKTSSAAVAMHHNMKGGLIYHSYRMMKAADALCSVYTDLDRELLLCGAALHDIGKIWEYSTSAYGSAEFTTAGVLFGHLYLGANLIRNYASKGNYNAEKVMLLTHMILSHHGTMEFGAVKTPAFAEAFMLHYIDNIDAKIGTCENYYATLHPGEMTDKKVFGLDNRIYRPNMGME